MLDTIIIGAGPSGLSCALNLRRDNKEVLLIEKEGIGGQIAKSPKVENIPGTKSISGLEFVDNLTAQVMDLGANFEFDEVISITKENNIFKVNTKYNSFENPFKIYLLLYSMHPPDYWCQNAVICFAFVLSAFRSSASKTTTLLGGTSRKLLC